MLAEKFLKQWVIPPGIIEVLSNVYHDSKMRISFEDKKVLTKNLIFKDKYKGKRCFVIGNGSSLNKQDLTLLTPELTFVMNAFWKNPILKYWQPRFYFFADPKLFEGAPPLKEFFKSMLNINQTIFFGPLSAKNIIESDSLLPQQQTFYAAFKGGLAETTTKNIDFVQPIPSVQSVSQFAIMAAIYMGFSSIYLIGLDHDWLAHRGFDKHFYAGETIENHPLAQCDLNKIPYRTDLEAMLNLWKGYETIKTIADCHHTQIYNATDGGFLDVFPRKQYETLFNQ